MASLRFTSLACALSWAALSHLGCTTSTSVDGGATGGADVSDTGGRADGGQDGTGGGDGDGGSTDATGGSDPDGTGGSDPDGTGGADPDGTGGDSQGGDSSGGADVGGSASGGSAATGGAATGGGPACAGGRLCVPPAPSEWVGPVTFATVADDGSAAPSCPGEFPSSIVSVKAGLDAPSASCGCSCTKGAPQCRLVSDVRGVIGTAPGDACDSIGDELYSAAIHVPCTANPAASIPAAGFDDVGRICGGASGTAECAGADRCFELPSGAFSAICVYRSGDHACPAPFNDKHLFHDGLSDTRACSPCSCSPSGSCSVTVEGCGLNGETVVLYSNTGNEVGANGDDTDYEFKSSSISTSVCTPSASTLQGAVSPVGAHTLCCLP